ncbi:right-handed parallel beta-helix repeat-containing protein [Streptomyces sp. NPDC020096]
MPVRIAWAVRRRWAPAMVAAMAAGAVGLVGAVPAAATGHGTHRAKVDCHHDPSALRTAIADAPWGATLRVEGTCVGPFVISEDLTLIGIERAVLDGNHAGSTVSVIGGARVRLAYLTITHGDAPGEGGGGGILNSGGTLTLEHSTVKGNTAHGGGGLSNIESGTMTVEHSTVKDNTAADESGGIFSNATLTLTDSTVRDNTARDGAGIENFRGTMTLDRSAVRHNRATHQGGGILNDSGRVTLTRSKVRDNTANGSPGAAGGGIFNSGTVTLDRSTVRDNHPDNCAPFGSVPGCIG